MAERWVVNASPLIVLAKVGHLLSALADEIVVPQTLNAPLLPRIRRQLPYLQAGDFVNRAQNVLCFGLPGTGKTHLVAAMGHALVENGRAVLFTPTFKLVGRLLRAKQEYELERELRRLDRFEVVILDDIGYVQQSREEMEVLFTFLSEGTSGIVW